MLTFPAETCRTILSKRGTEQFRNRTKREVSNGRFQQKKEKRNSYCSGSHLFTVGSRNGSRTFGKLLTKGRRESEVHMKKRKWEKLAVLLLVFAFLVTGFPTSVKAEETEPEISPNVSVDGVSLGGLSAKEAEEKLTEMEESWSDVSVTLTSDFGNVETTLGDLGFQADVDGALHKAAGYANSGTILKRYREKKQEAQSHDFEIGKSVSTDRVKSVVNGKLARVFDGSENASLIRINETKVSVAPGNNNVRLDAEATRNAIQEVITGDWDHSDIRVPLTIVDNQEGSESQELSYITDLLGTYTTEFGQGDQGRNQNIARAAELMNGKIVYPGEEVSTYYTIEPIEDYNGYAMAGVFVHNEVVQGIGGGVCQMSSTLYNALLWAEVEIVKRDYHGLPVSYVPLSYDATMAGGYLDLIFRNNLEHAIYIEIDCNLEEGYITANVWGHEYRDPKREIKFENNIVEEIEKPEDVTEVDPEMEPGTEEVVSNGTTGYKTELWKYVYYDGELQDKVLINTSNYSATPKKIKKGPDKNSGVSASTDVTEDTESTEKKEETTDPADKKKKKKKTEEPAEDNSEEPTDPDGGDVGPDDSPDDDGSDDGSDDGAVVLDPEELQ